MLIGSRVPVWGGIILVSHPSANLRLIYGDSEQYRNYR